MEEFKDETLICKDCGKEFIFTAGEQEFYKQNEFKNKPARCKACRDAKKAKFNSGGNRNFNSRNNFSDRRAA